MTRHVPRQARAPISERPAGPLPVQCLAVPGGDAMRFSVGTDGASAANAVSTLDHPARAHGRGAGPPTADGLAALLARLRRFRRRGSLRVALERPSGLLVDTLLDAGLEVVPIHPNALKASRPRYSAAGAKSDPGDAFILADLLRTDGHRFPSLRPPSDDTRALRALVRGRDDLVAQRIALANQLRALLERFWPGAAAIFADVDSPIALAFLARYPTPDSAARLGEQRLAQFLGQHAYCGRRPVAELLARLRRAPTSQVGAAEADASGDVVRALVAVLSPLMPRAGRPSSISAPARVGVGISMRSAFSPARGPASSGAAGRIARPTTSRGIALRRRSPLPERAMVDTGCLMGQAPREGLARPQLLAAHHAHLGSRARAGHPLAILARTSLSSKVSTCQNC